MKKRLKLKNFRNDLTEEMSKSAKFREAFMIERAKLSFAHKLGELRESMGLTQAQLARKMGISQQLISRIEGGSDNLTLETIIRFLYVFNVAVRIGVFPRKNKKDLLQFA